MTEQNQPEEINNEALFDVVEKHVTTVKLPAIMHKSGDPVIIGEATVTKQDGFFEVYIKATLPEAQQMGSLLTSGIVSAVTLGGTIDRNSAAGSIINRLN